MASPIGRSRAGHCRSSPRSAAVPKSAAACETVAARFTSRKVLDVVGELRLRLIAGKGHWLFVYPRHQGRDLRHPFDLRHAPSDLSFGHWVEEARVFVAYVNTSWK
jgi:hypothetical protein